MIEMYVRLSSLPGVRVRLKNLTYEKGASGWKA
jgi:hypothetical protein